MADQYVKPQSLLKNGDKYIYPITSYDQIVMPNGGRWNGQPASTATYLATFSANRWSGSLPYTQTVSVAGILATDNPIVDIDFSAYTSDDASMLALEEWNLVQRVVANDGSVTMYCYDEKPTSDISIILKVVR